MRYSLLLLLFLSFSAVKAADTSVPTSRLNSAVSTLSPAKDAIESGNFSKAIELLLAVDQKQSADWNNLMGYSLRKKSNPDLNEAEKYYQIALNLDPKHRGALEYYGELLLLKNDLNGAEIMLSRLDKACVFSCEEYRDLKKSIQQYKTKK